jgi:hypothetical protein
MVRPKDRKTSIKQEIETWTVRILDNHLNLKNFSTPAVDHMSESYREQRDCLPLSWSREEHLNNLRKHFRTMPDFHLKILNISSRIDEDHGRATVYTWCQVTRAAGDFEREVVSVMHWERRQSRWLCVKNHDVRGPPAWVDHMMGMSILPRRERAMLMPIHPTLRVRSLLTTLCLWRASLVERCASRRLPFSSSRAT